MAKKNKNEIAENTTQKAETSSKVGYRIILKTKTFIIIDKYGINVRINLPMQELVKYKVNDIYYL